MSCGIPVVAVDRGAIGELVSDETGIVVRAGSATALAEGIRAMYEGDYQAMGARARTTVQSAYSWDIVMRTLLKTYMRLAASTAPSTAAVYAAD
jgi:glycosyltransferase involved in cell wall biosynthesis